jgi:cell division transport system permease protein
MTLWLRMHAQAFAASVARLASQPVATALAVLVIALAVALPVLAAVGLKSLTAATAGLDTDPHVNLYLTLEATEEDARKLEATLRAHPDVASVRFVPRAQALEELKSTTHLAELLASLDRNPLPHALTVRTRTMPSERLRELRGQWQKLAKVDQVVADFEWSERLSRWIRFGDRALAGLALFLAVAVVLIIGHLIRLQVLTQRAEIELSQLIGATAADVRRPFLYFGALQGLLAGAAALVLAAGFTAWIGYELRALTSSYATEFKTSFLDSDATALTILGVAAQGWLGAWLSVSRELRRFGPPR